MIINQELIHKLENLARIELNEEERNQLKDELAAMIGMFDKIAEVPTDDVLPLIHLTDSLNVMREDISGSGLSIDEVHLNSPESSDRFFVVPKVID